MQPVLADLMVTFMCVIGVAGLSLWLFGLAWCALFACELTARLWPLDRKPAGAIERVLPLQGRWLRMGLRTVTFPALLLGSVCLVTLLLALLLAVLGWTLSFVTPSQG